MANVIYSQFLSYFLVAGIAVCINIIVRFLCNFTFSFALSIIIGYIIGHFANFYLSYKYIFPKTPNTNIKRNFIKFSFIASIGLCIAFSISIFILDFLRTYFLFITPKIKEFLAHITGIGVSFIFNFIGHKFFSFVQTGIFEKITIKKENK